MKPLRIRRSVIPSWLDSASCKITLIYLNIPDGYWVYIIYNLQRNIPRLVPTFGLQCSFCRQINHFANHTSPQVVFWKCVQALLIVYIYAGIFRMVFNINFWTHPWQSSKSATEETKDMKIFQILASYSVFWFFAFMKILLCFACTTLIIHKLYEFFWQLDEILLRN